MRQFPPRCGLSSCTKISVVSANTAIFVDVEPGLMARILNGMVDLRDFSAYIVLLFKGFVKRIYFLGCFGRIYLVLQGNYISRKTNAVFEVRMWILA